jgi:hypothetical protein
MKNAFKIGLLAAAVTTTILACDPSHSASNSGQTKPDSPKTKVDTAIKAGIDTTTKDTTKK